MTVPYFVFGAGPHGRVVRDALDRRGYAVAGFVDDHLDVSGREVDGVPVLGAVEWLGRQAPQHAAIGIGNNDARLQVINRVRAAGHVAELVVDPTAAVARRVQLGAGTFIGMLAGVGTGCAIGAGVVINTGARVDHDGVIEEGAYLAPGACCAGGVRVGARAFVGAGATIGPGVDIGHDAVVGAGSVVLSDLPPYSVAYGVPATVRRMREPGVPLDWRHILGGSDKGGA